jgi:YjjG family noncanonical pyrimidine nucleotidase
MRYKWIIFDADGTLFDYDKAESSAIKSTIEQFGFQYLPEYLPVYRTCNKQLWDAFELGNVTIENLKVQRFELFLQTIALEADAHHFSDHYLHHLSKGAHLISGAKKLLHNLSGKVGLILMTNGIKEVQRSRLSLSPIQSFFSDIIISDEVGVAKPDRKIFEIALHNMSITDKRSILMVGDNLTSDIKGGIDFGIDTCWYNPKCLDNNHQIKATYEIRNLEDLMPILEAN